MKSSTPKKMEKETNKERPYLAYGIIGATILFIGWMGYRIEQGHSETRYNAAVSAQHSDDPCATPAGYTDEEWREHMGHHPDQYEECL